MTCKQAAQALVELLADYRRMNGHDIKPKYYEAVSMACAVLQIDDVLNHFDEEKQT